MNNKFIFFLLLLKASLQWRRCLDESRRITASDRVSFTATVVGDDFYLIGGIKGYGLNKNSIPNKSIYKITYNSCDDIQFEEKTTTLDIYNHAAVYIPSGEFKNCIFLFGGESVYPEDRESILYYNISSDSLGNITSAEYPYGGSRAYYIEDLHKVALIGGKYGPKNNEIYNSISYFDLNTLELESYTSKNFDSAKRYSFASSLNEIEDENGKKRKLITYFGGYDQNKQYTKSLYQYDTSIPKDPPTYISFDGPDLNREYSNGVGWKHYLVFPGGTFHYSDRFYLSERTLLYDILNRKLLEVKDENYGVWQHESIVVKNDILLVVGGSGTEIRKTDYFILNLTTASFQKAEEDIFNPLMYYLIGAGCVVLIGLMMCCCLYCLLSYIARRRFERQAIDIERMLHGAAQRIVPEDILDTIVKEEFAASKHHQQTCCTICIIEFIENEKIKVLPCQHIFHPECIDQWLRQKDMCPVCKREVLNEDGTRLVASIAWEEDNNSVNEIDVKNNNNRPDEIEMTQMNIHKSSKDSITINVAPVGSGTNIPNRTSTPNTNRRQVVTPTSISVQNSSANNSINNSIQFQPPNTPFQDMGGI